jgi:hypothetical protein
MTARDVYCVRAVADFTIPAAAFLYGEDPMNYQAFTNASLAMMYHAVRGARPGGFYRLNKVLMARARLSLI